MLSLSQILNRFEGQMGKLLILQNDLHPSVELEKKYMITQGFVALTSFVFAAIVGYLISATLIIEFSLIYIPIAGVEILSFYYGKKNGSLILLFKITMIILSSVYIVRMGGLLTSGGLFLLGLQAVTSTIIFRDLRKILLVAGVFMISILALILFQPFFPTENALNQRQNAIIFAMIIFSITGWIVFFSLYAIELFKEIEQRETIRQIELNKAKTSLFTNITHEFRTPLTIILGLADSMSNSLNREVKEKANTIVDNGRNLLQMVNQMLELSKLESKNLKVNLVHGNIIPFLRYLINLQVYTAREKGIALKFNSENESYFMDFDPEKITSIVTNLIDNAVKFTPVGGKVELKVSIVGHELIMEIKDTGIGIPAENQEEIFNRFYQIDQSNTRRVNGTGIGLALTKELVDLMQGKIELKSRVGSGTLFTVSLPMKAKSNQVIQSIDIEEDLLVDQQISTEPKIPSGTEIYPQLLIVDDNPDINQYLTSCFKNTYQVNIAQNGKEGLRMAFALIPDIIICDVMMPGIDGFKLCRRLKNDFRTSHVPIILLTAKADLESRIEGLQQGADAYVTKPFNKEELQTRMNKLIDVRKKIFSYFNNGLDSFKSNDPVLKKENEFFDKLNEVIQKHLKDENFDIQRLCKELAMSKSQLYRKFKALTNMSVAKYIRCVRMKKAKELLQISSLSITEIGYEVGMKSVSGFSQIFKEEFGYSPSDFIHQKNKSKSVSS